MRADADCDVLVVGAGISGALIADALSAARMRVLMIDRREAGWGSTAASTALLQYEIDTEMQILAEQFGIDDAVLAYRSCEQAVQQFGRLAKRLRTVDFRPMQSLYVASRHRHERRLRAEAKLRRAHGFDVQTLEPAAIRSRFGIEAPVALLTRVAAEVDPYRFTHALLARLRRRGVAIHGRTELAGFTAQRSDVRVRTSDGRTIRCRQLVFAAGYESQNHLDQRVARNRSSYVFVSEPLAGGTEQLRDTLLWESARPYLYLRTTRDQRVIVGGLDDSVDIAGKRDARLEKKSGALAKQAAQRLPALALTPAFSWAGTFAETKDGLPFFGPHEQHGPRVHFAMAYGGNGISYSVIGAGILRALIQGKSHPCAKLFSFERLKR